jgi:hypothetical protein
MQRKSDRVGLHVQKEQFLRRVGTLSRFSATPLAALSFHVKFEFLSDPVFLPLSDCDKRDEPPGHDHRPLSLVAPDVDGRAPDERGARHLLALVRFCNMQHNKERERRPTASRGE